MNCCTIKEWFIKYILFNSFWSHTDQCTWIKLSTDGNKGLQKSLMVHYYKHAVLGSNFVRPFLHLYQKISVHHSRFSPYVSKHFFTSLKSDSKWTASKILKSIRLFDRKWNQLKPGCLENYRNARIQHQRIRIQCKKLLHSISVL